MFWGGECIIEHNKEKIGTKYKFEEIQQAIWVIKIEDVEIEVNVVFNKFDKNHIKWVLQKVYLLNK